MYVAGREILWAEIKSWPRVGGALKEDGRSEVFVRAFFVGVLALVVASMEINIEGAAGWAADLPVWRPNPDVWYARVWSWLMGGKPMDGYHLAAFTLWNLLFFIPFFFGAEFSGRRVAEALMWSHFLAIAEDFLWFVWNGHYGIGRFDAAHIPWHHTWWGFVPNDYPIMIARGLFCALFAPRGLRGGVVALAVLVGFVLGNVLLVAARVAE